MINYGKFEKKILAYLEERLPAELYYHGIHHTRDVLAVCNDYIERDGLGETDALLLRTGALFHDLGFTLSFEDHEENGKKLAEELLPDFGFNKVDIGIVKGMIESTKVPQNPLSPLERIICDADLDYLGRKDYYEISETLYRELKALSKISDRTHWTQLQIDFLKAHRYHTEFAISYRQPEKEERIRELQKR